MYAVSSVMNTDRNPIPGTALGQLLATRTGTDTADQDHSPICIDTVATAVMILMEVIPDHMVEIMDTAIGAFCDALIPILIIHAVTPHITDLPHTVSHQLTLRTTADHDADQHTNQVRKNSINLHHVPAELKQDHMIKETQES